MDEKLPALQETESRDGSEQGWAKGNADQVWLRISGFLSLKSKNTQRTYLGIINEWCEFLGEAAGTRGAAEKLLHAEDTHAIAYRNWLQGQPGQEPRLKRSSSNGTIDIALRNGHSHTRDGTQSTLSNATIAKKFAALRRIYRMLKGSGLVTQPNPFDRDRVPVPRAQSGQKRPTEMISFSMVRAIVSLPDDSTPKGLRDKAILAVLFGGGLRRSEVVALRIGDVQKSSQGTIFLRLRGTKSGKDCDQALPGWAGEVITRLVEHHVSLGAQSGDYLFVSYRGQGGNTPTKKPLSDSGLYKLFKSYCKEAGAGSFVSPHSARATAITKLLADGIPHREVQEFSRHSSVQMVELYDKRRFGVDESPAKELDFD